MAQSDVSPEEAFALLGNETRIGIIRVLGEAGGTALAFSELRKRVGTRDSGQFNYHLQQLVDRFVHQTSDERYELSYAGSRVVGAIYSGDFTKSGSLGTVPLSSECIVCETQLEATYEDEQMEITCPECDHIDTAFGFPPGGVEERTPSELTRVLDRWLTTVFRLVGEGICFNCTGAVSGRLTDESDYLPPDDEVCVEFECTRCEDTITASVRTYLFYDRRVMRFFSDHGIDQGDVEIWNVNVFADPDISVTSRSPWEIETTFERDGDALTIELDESLATAIRNR